MPILLRCHNCNKRLQVDDAFAGSLCRCIHCGALSEVPATAAASLGDASRPLTPVTKRDKERLSRSASFVAPEPRASDSDSSLSQQVAPTVAVSDDTQMHSRILIEPSRPSGLGRLVARLIATGVVVFLVVFVTVRAMRAEHQAPTVPDQGPSSTTAPAPDRS